MDFDAAFFGIFLSGFIGSAMGTLAMWMLIVMVRSSEDDDQK